MFQQYLSPLSPKWLQTLNVPHPQQLANVIDIYDGDNMPDLHTIDLAIIGIPEARNSQNSSSHLAPDEIRAQLYQMFCWTKPVHIVDLGNLIQGKTPQDTYEGTAEVMANLLQHKVIPIVLGGSNDIAYALYRGFAWLEQTVSIVAVD
ncbi:MAG: arginase family protein, partial [Bacteroidales bacterium]|jgi:arginase family enzyme|nr:arginase family protein [Bacteroidales bacterium]